MRKCDETIYVEMSPALAEWILSLACDDLKRGMAGADLNLSQEEATAFAMFLQSNLPPTVLEVPALRQKLRAS